MKKVGIIGWRGMVGSVLLDRMRAEHDFDLIEPLFFSTSRSGDRAPQTGREAPPVADARNLDALAAMDILVSCQGSEYTAHIHPQLRAAGHTCQTANAKVAISFRASTESACSARRCAAVSASNAARRS